MGARRLYFAVVGCAVVVYLGALWTRFALDDNPVVVFNALVHGWSGVWRAFGAPYWPPDVGGGMYRPLTIATFALDWQVGGATWWFHAVNVGWHAAASAAAALLARRWCGDRAALVTGLLFAVHPVHVEAVANVVGRAELMATLFAVLSIYAALAHDRVWWSAAALAAGLLSKENAAVVPALIVWGWAVGGRLHRPSRGRMALYGGSWIALAAAYAAVRWGVLHENLVINTAPVFIGASPIAVRLTAVAAFADFARLLVFPLKLRVDYSPAERTLVTTPFDLRFALGLACFAVWAGLLLLAWRRGGEGGRRVEAFGLGWVAIALLPVVNLLFPTGVLVAERTLYLPSVGLALAAGAWLGDLVAPRRLAWGLGVLVAAGGVRTALRVPVWRDVHSVVLSELVDSPRSYQGPAHMVVLYLNARQPEKALAAFQAATSIYDRTLPWVYVTGAEAAFAAGRPALADTLLARLERGCPRCDVYYRYEAGAALARGNAGAAEMFLERMRKAARSSP